MAVWKLEKGELWQQGPGALFLMGCSSRPNNIKHPLSILVQQETQASSRLHNSFLSPEFLSYCMHLRILLSSVLLQLGFYGAGFYLMHFIVSRNPSWFCFLLETEKLGYMFQKQMHSAGVCSSLFSSANAAWVRLTRVTAPLYWMTGSHLQRIPTALWHDVLSGGYWPKFVLGHPEGNKCESIFSYLVMQANGETAEQYYEGPAGLIG